MNANGLHARGELQKRAEAELARARRFDRPLGLALIEIDAYEGIRQELGSRAVRLISAITGRAIVGNLRRYDRVGLWGDGRYAVLFPEADEAGAYAAAERIIAAVRSVPEFRSAPVPMTVSAGVAVLMHPADTDLLFLLGAATTALERAQLDGGNRVEREPCAAPTLGRLVTRVEGRP